ncbi:MAG TPA: ATP synthase F1 subunit delta [Planctomycetaceae bacterium]|nr:ATP synthase F1 subunit delta [Planctomycetaceae bacterium]HBH54916.1 ATP synthase F1 subunit delta [Planctomycetaceae bacterium]
MRVWLSRCDESLRHVFSVGTSMTQQQQPAVRIPSVMEDPSVDSIARVYADALLDAVGKEQQSELISELESFVQDVLPRNAEFQRLLNSAAVSRDDKLSLIERVLGDRGSAVLVNFLKVLARHGRLDILGPICRQVGLQSELRAGRRRVQVVSAIPATPALHKLVQESLSKSLDFTPIVEWSVDESLVGGLRIRVGDTVYDGSLRSRLRQMQQRVEQRSTHEIQSGRDRFSHPEGD